MEEIVTISSFFPLVLIIMLRKKRIIKPGAKTTTKKKVSVTPTAMEYINLFNTCVIKKEKIAQVDKIIDDKIVANRSRYEQISLLVRGGNSNSGLFGNNPLFQPSNPFYKWFTPTSRLLSGSLVSNNYILKQPSFKRGDGSILRQSNFTDNSDKFGLNRDPFSVGFFNSSSVPWYFIACVHYMECGFSFKKHLHNGDPLTGYTVHVPAHRPKVGHAPPFTFEESAVDAIKLMKYDQVTNWSLPYILLKLEGYNGFGYNRKGIKSPYLWSFSNHYTKGKYVKDGVFDANAVSTQMGAAVILKRMEERGLITIPRN
ncbi:hypothetical protein [Mucilaginibacter sp. KACC 22063]|uniref:hypothetical protein n=1 Tax=Mucilaginibacter sp. KACC 22063 TaxID=3025666 RepID=UPI0023670C23|nr:hypothetical protein [Mucilaginibacter sp. KACC 22063]WDF54391.1 hypothetical protein PQ461_15720 [Mucilaginibacter sp. KACC 22063]